MRGAIRFNGPPRQQQAEDYAENQLFLPRQALHAKETSIGCPFPQRQNPPEITDFHPHSWQPDAPANAPLPDYNIHQFLLNDDYFPDGFACNEWLHFLGLKRGSFEFLPRGAGCHANHVPQLPIHLDRDFHHVLDQNFGIEAGPGSVGQVRCPRAKLCGKGGAQPGPEFLGQMWGKRLQED